LLPPSTVGAWNRPAGTLLRCDLARIAVEILDVLPGSNNTSFRHRDDGKEVLNDRAAKNQRAAAATTTSGVSSSRSVSCTEASASASGDGGKAAFGMAITARPAASADRSPLDESSTATARSGRTPSRAATVR